MNFPLYSSNRSWTNNYRVYQGTLKTQFVELLLLTVSFRNFGSFFDLDLLKKPSKLLIADRFFVVLSGSLFII